LNQELIRSRKHDSPSLLRFVPKGRRLREGKIEKGRDKNGRESYET